MNYIVSGMSVSFSISSDFRLRISYFAFTIPLQLPDPVPLKSILLKPTYHRLFLK